MGQKVEFGASHVMYALETEDGFGEWKPMAGAVNVTFEPQESQNTFYADNVAYYVSFGAANDTATVEIALLSDQAKIDLLGYFRDQTSGLLCVPVKARRPRFAMGYQVEGADDDGNEVHLRGVRYGGTMARPGASHATTTEQTEVNTTSCSITFAGKDFYIDGEDVPVLGAACTDEETPHDAYDQFFTSVPQPGVSPA